MLTRSARDVTKLVLRAAALVSAAASEDKPRSKRSIAAKRAWLKRQAQGKKGPAKKKGSVTKKRATVRRISPTAPMWIQQRHELFERPGVPCSYVNLDGWGPEYPILHQEDDEHDPSQTAVTVVESDGEVRRY
jgi:hypothetical protein